MILLLIVLLGFVLRVISINQSFWLDEATSVLVARDFSFSDIITRFSPGDFHPPLYYFLLKIWIGVFGATEIGARSLSVVLGLATIPLVFLIGRKLLNKETGLIAALFFATAPLHIYYSQEARMYVLATFLATLLILFFLRIKKDSRRFYNWVGFIIAGSLLIYTHYQTLSLFIVLIAYLWMSQRKFFLDNFRKWFLSFALIAVFFLFWTPVLAKQLHTAVLAKMNTPGWWVVLGQANLKQLALVPIKLLIGRISSYNKVFYAISILFPLALSGYLLARSISFIKKTLLIWLWLLIPVAVSAIFGWFSSGFSYFRLLFVLPAFYLLLAFGAVSIKSKTLKQGVVLALLIVNLVASGIYLFNPKFHREDWREAVRFIEERSRGKSTASIFVTRNQRDPYRYYSEGYVLPYGPEGLAKGPFTTIWLFRYVQPIFDPDDALRKRVEELGYIKRAEHDFNGVIVWEYNKI